MEEKHSIHEYFSLEKSTLKNVSFFANFTNWGLIILTENPNTAMVVTFLNLYNGIGWKSRRDKISCVSLTGERR